MKDHETDACPCSTPQAQRPPARDAGFPSPAKLAGRAAVWARTMSGTATPSGAVLAHGVSGRPHVEASTITRLAREEAEELLLARGATRSIGAGKRSREETPDPLRTCFERDRDRILHSSAFRRLAGKTQVFVFPLDHQRTRLTHALEVTQVAGAVARATGLNVALTEAIALGHDCGHGPGGHASEDAFSAYLSAGFDHAIWGADVVLAPLNLCAETLDGIRHHSWSLPSPVTPEGALVSWADRCAYCAHDLEDAARVGLADPDELPPAVADVAGTSRSTQLRCFVNALVDCITSTGEIAMREPYAGALAALREFNYEHIYTRPSSVAQGQAVIAVLSALVEFFVHNPSLLPGADQALRAGPEVTLGDERPSTDGGGTDPLTHRAVSYVSGMTDRFAFSTAVRLLGWRPERLPRVVGS